MMQDIKDLSLADLENVLKEWGASWFHAQQIFSWIYKKAIRDFAGMSDLPLGLRNTLRESFYLFSLKLVKSYCSKDGTEKFLFALRDASFIEAVSIPTEKRVTGCISTQAGCKFKCLFCASGLSGLRRNLTSSEMIEEAIYLRNNSKGQRLTHIVFMGTGEPLDNYENVVKAIEKINSPEGLNIGARRITVSTCGIIPGIRRLRDEGLQIELSVSLHAACDRIRSQIMPINKKYPLGDLMRACQDYIKKTNRQITFEYVLINGINSDLQNAKELSKILKNLNCKVNLIPCNALKECKVKPPDKLEISLFKDFLIKSGINVTLRKPRGQDIQAACGQLRLRYAKK